MDDVLKVLYDEHNPEKIISACNIAISDFRRNQTDWTRGDVEVLENCFFKVFLSNIENLQVLSCIVKTLIEFLNLYKDVKLSLCKKGIFFNIDHFLINNHSDLEEQMQYLKCGYSLAIALTDNCPETLEHFSDTGILNSILKSLMTYYLNKDIVTLCLHQLSILISENDADVPCGIELMNMKLSWCKQVFESKFNLEPLSVYILEMMNRHPVDSENLLLYGLKCLNSFSLLEGGAEQVCSFGGLDTVCHILYVHCENYLIMKESFCLIKSFLQNVNFDSIASKCNDLCEVFSKALQSSINNTKRILEICDALTALLLVGSDLGQYLLCHNLHRHLFRALDQAQSRSSAYLSESGTACLRLARCLFLILANPSQDIRNDVLLDACHNSEIDLALFVISLGANINYKSDDERQPLVIACQNEDETLVKQLLVLMSTFQYIGVMKSRIDQPREALMISLQKRNNHVVAALLWYLLHRDLNGVAEWGNHNLIRLKSEWLEVAFTAQECNNNNVDEDAADFSLASVVQTKWYQLGLAVIQSFSSLDSSEKKDQVLLEALKEKFNLFHSGNESQKKCPLQQIQFLIKNGTAIKRISRGSGRAVDEFMHIAIEYKCPRCCGHTSFREYLKLSFDYETLLEESIHRSPVEICTCPVLFPPVQFTTNDIKELQLSRNNLASLDSFSHLSHDTRRRLSHSVRRITLLDNKLTAIPAAFAQIFESLVDLNLSRNQLILFPFEVLLHCPLLEVLDLSDNLIQEGRDFPFESTGHDVSISPGSFRHGLKTLKLSSNAVTDFPIWIFQVLPQLTSLYMRKNLLEKIADQDKLFEIATQSSDFLYSLEHVDLSQNNIVQVAVSLLRYARNLRHIDLSQNNIAAVTIDNETCLVDSKLSHIDLSQNQLTEIPRFVYFLSRLKTLILSKNSIHSVPFVTASWKTKTLSELDLSHNDITDVFSLVSILARYWPSTLTKLTLSHNAVVELPPTLGELRALEVLDVSDNRIKILPDELGLLANLKSFKFHKNELGLEKTILTGTAQQVRQFLYARLKKSVPQNRVKLILVGDPHAGKTTLLNSLMRMRRSRTFSGSFAEAITGSDAKSQTNLATVGVNVVEINLSKDNRSYQLSVWDFAGQEEFYATHPCFISERAMYIAMYDASKGAEKLHSLKPWLTAIHARATHCPVLIIGSHADMLPRNKEFAAALRCELQTLSQQPWFPRGAQKPNGVWHELFDVRKNSSGMSTLKSLIIDVISGAMIQDYRLVGNMVPYSYVQLSDLLKRESNRRPDFPVISFNELVALLQDQNDPLCPQFESCTELMLAIKYLHQTGFLLHFDEPRSRLQDCFFIEPAWLCKLFAQVVTIKEDSPYKISPFIDNEGVLSKSIFTRNIISTQSNKNALPTSFLPRLFRLLENFEVILWQGKDCYLVPSRLPTEKPDIQLPVRHPRDKMIRYYSMVYTPMGLWPRLLARLLVFANKLLHGCAGRENDPCVTRTWREGVYFEWANSSSNVNPNPFVLVQSGSEEYESACNIQDDSSFSDDSSVSDIVSLSGSKKNSSIEVVVPRSISGQILLAQLSDHITTLVEEWYPGMLRMDVRGRCLFQQYSPCFVCYDASDSVHSFCISDLADSVFSNREKNPLCEKTRYDVKESSSGMLLVYCPNHVITPVPLVYIAPEINLDDFDPSLRLDPDLLSFEETSKKLLGGGGFGAVYRATYNGEEVAIKTFYQSSDVSYKMLRVELNVLAQHQHPSIVSLKGFIPPAFSSSHLPLPLLALEYAQLGSLGKLLASMAKMQVEARNSALSPFMRHRIAYEVADGLCFLHRRNVVYRDLKPDNILLTSLNPSDPTIAKITDYGISTLASPSGIPGPSGSPGYKAPEVVCLKISGRNQDLLPYTVKCDVYSFGLVLHELAVGRSPWVDYVYEEHHSEKATSRMPAHPDEIVLMGILPSPISSYKGASSWPYAQELVSNCLKRNPEERPTMCQIVSLLSDVQSICFRSLVPLLSSDPVFPRTYRNTSSDSNAFLRCISYVDGDDARFASTNQRPDTHIYYSTSSFYTDDSDAFSVMKLVVDLEKGSVLSDDVWLSLDGAMTVACMVQIPRIPLSSGKTLDRTRFLGRSMSVKREPSSSVVIVAGTVEGHVIAMRSGSYVIKHKHDCEVTNVHFHRCSEKKTHGGAVESGFVVIALQNRTLVVYSLEQMSDSCSRRPLHILDLNGVSDTHAHTVHSIDNSLYAVCGKIVVVIAMADRPVVEGSVEVKGCVQNFSAGRTHFYLNVCNSDQVQVWKCGRFQPCKRLDALTSYYQKADRPSTIAAVSSIYVDDLHSALWVGFTTGHVAVYSTPQHHLLALVHRHTGPVQHIFALEDSVPDCETIVCLGQGSRPVSADIERHLDESMPREKGDETARRESSRSFYLTLWDSDLPKQAPLFSSIVNARKTLLR